MRIGIVSDTHGHEQYTLDAVRMLECLDVERVIHCGDIGSPNIPAHFAQWPTHYVLGNVDRDVPALEQAVSAIGHTLHGDQAELVWDDCRIAVTHGHRAELLEAYVQSGEWDLVCCGHTHKSRCDRVSNTLVINPGALFRATIHSLAYVETDGQSPTQMRGEIIPIH